MQTMGIRFPFGLSSMIVPPVLASALEHPVLSFGKGNPPISGCLPGALLMLRQTVNEFYSAYSGTLRSVFFLCVASVKRRVNYYAAINTGILRNLTRTLQALEPASDSPRKTCSKMYRSSLSLL